MKRIKIIKPFKFAEDGITVIHYSPGVEIVSEHVAAVALQNGWAKKPFSFFNGKGV